MDGKRLILGLIVPIGVALLFSVAYVAPLMRPVEPSIEARANEARLLEVMKVKGAEMDRLRREAEAARENDERMACLGMGGHSVKFEIRQFKVEDKLFGSVSGSLSGDFRGWGILLFGLGGGRGDGSVKGDLSGTVEDIPNARFFLNDGGRWRYMAVPTEKLVFIDDSGNFIEEQFWNEWEWDQKKIRNTCNKKLELRIHVSL